MGLKVINTIKSKKNFKNKDKQILLTCLSLFFCTFLLKIKFVKI